MARRKLLDREKELTRLRDELARERRDLPWVRIDRIYNFETDEGIKTLDKLFDGRSQLLVCHFMLGPDWTEGCPSCSFWADNFDGAIVHLNQRDVTMLPSHNTSRYSKRLALSASRDGTRRLYRARPDGLAKLRSYLDDFWDESLVVLKREAELEGRSRRSIRC